MKILLDIDGVMVPATSWKAPEMHKDGFPNFSQRTVSSLNKILSSTNASLLLTTSHKTKYSNKAWRRIFADRGINAKISTLNNTKDFQSRKDEVLEWLQNHQSERNFVIIDDDKSLNDLPERYRYAVILTSPLIGVNEEVANQAIRILRNNA